MLCGIISNISHNKIFLAVTEVMTNKTFVRLCHDFVDKTRPIKFLLVKVSKQYLWVVRLIWNKV